MSAGSPILLLVLFFGLAAVGGIIFGTKRDTAPLSRTWALAAVVPSVIQLTLFYSLAVHIHHSLGRWPSNIGEQGFSSPLLSHARIATHYLEILSVFTFILWPVAFLLCLFIRSWRRWTRYLGIYFISCLVCFGFTLLAPSPYLNWWWD